VGLAATGTLLGCGGGEDDEPPTISLAANADDDNGLKEVVFYSVGTNVEVPLAKFTSFTGGPLLHQVIIPTGATGSVSYKARAIDNDDQETDSNTVSVTVTT
jgi:hypothetical protein